MNTIPLSKICSINVTFQRSIIVPYTFSAREVFNIKIGTAPEKTNDRSSFMNTPYQFHADTKFRLGNICEQCNVTEKLHKKWGFPLRIWSHLLKESLMENSFFVQWETHSFTGHFLWRKVPKDCKTSDSLDKFQNKIKIWTPENLFYKFCKKYFHQIVYACKG